MPNLSLQYILVYNSGKSYLRSLKWRCRRYQKYFVTRPVIWWSILRYWFILLMEAQLSLKPSVLVVPILAAKLQYDWFEIGIVFVIPIFGQTFEIQKWGVPVLVLNDGHNNPWPLTVIRKVSRKKVSSNQIWYTWRAVVQEDYYVTLIIYHEFSKGEIDLNRGPTPARKPGKLEGIL